MGTWNPNPLRGKYFHLLRRPFPAHPPQPSLPDHSRSRSGVSTPLLTPSLVWWGVGRISQIWAFFNGGGTAGASGGSSSFSSSEGFLNPQTHCRSLSARSNSHREQDHSVTNSESKNCERPNHRNHHRPNEKEPAFSNSQKRMVQKAKSASSYNFP